MTNITNTKERPLCRKWIIENDCRPRVIDGEWNGKNVMDCNGHSIFLSNGLMKQMRKMVRECHWGIIKIVIRRPQRIEYY